MSLDSFLLIVFIIYIVVIVLFRKVFFSICRMIVSLLETKFNESLDKHEANKKRNNKKEN